MGEGEDEERRGGGREIEEIEERESVWERQRMEREEGERVREELRREA